MMILEVRDVRERVDETHRTEEVAEREFAADRLRIGGESPAAVEGGAQPLRLGARERRHAALAGHAFAVTQFVHAALLRAKRRAT